MFEVDKMHKMENNKCVEINKFDESTELAQEVETFVTEKLVEGDGLGPQWMFWKRRRYLVMFLSFLGQLTRELLRTNLSVAIVKMTENRSTEDLNGTLVYEQEFEWDVKSRGLLLSVFFYGYMTTIMFGGIMAVKFGGTRLFGLGIGITAFTTLLTPAAAYTHYYLLIALRIFEGMCEGILIPCLEYVYSQWVPREERSLLVGFSSSGLYLGVFVAIILSSATTHHLGWPSVFYITGGWGLIWCLAWNLCVKECPRLDKTISLSERNYIESTVGKSRTMYRKINSIPFLKIMTSVPLWALIISHIPLACCYTLFATLLPSYIKDVLKQDTHNAGYLSALPFLANVVALYCCSPVADFLVNRNLLINITVRKIFICGGLVSFTFFCFMVQQVTSTTAVIVCCVGMLMSSGAVYTQAVVNLLDLAPSYSSVMSGLFVTVNASCGAQTPMIVAHLTPNQTTEEWNTVFSILGGMSMTTATVYGVFGSGKLQHWAVEKDRNRYNTNDIPD